MLELVTNRLGFLATHVNLSERYDVVKGVHLEIAGTSLTLSVQWGDGNYSNVGRGTYDPISEDPEDREPTFEIAVWDVSKTSDRGNGYEWIRMSAYDDVGPYLTLAEIERALLNVLKTQGAINV